MLLFQCQDNGARHNQESASTPDQGEPFAEKERGNQCQTRSVSAPVIEQAVVDQIRGIAGNPEVVGEVVRQLDERRFASREGLERERRVIEKDLQRLGEEMASLVRMTGKLATDRMADLQDRVAVLERQLRDVRDQLAESVGQTMDAASLRKTLQEFDGVWTEMTPREQEKFVKTLVDRVSYDGTTCTVTVGFRTAGIRQLCLEVQDR